jgi:hypothetical protein
MLFLSFLLSLSTALAAPPCWTVNGSSIGPNKEGKNIADGEFLITMEISKATKDDLISVMQKVKFGNIKPNAYPSIFEDFIIFHVESIKENTERPALIEAVNGQIDEIAAIHGVKSVECNTAITR